MTCTHHVFHVTGDKGISYLPRDPNIKKLVALPSDAPVCCKVKKNLANFKQPPNVIEQPFLIDG